MLTINLQQEKEKIVHHTRSVLSKTGFEKVIVAISGGIDSATSLYLLNETISAKNIFAVHLYYFEKSKEKFYETIRPLNLPKDNILLYSIKDSVDTIATELRMDENGIPDQVWYDERIRLGNIMARVRMIMLYDLAKKHNALVCGTENRSEYHLGYFTRFGDAASDFEVINHLYKTQVRQLAQFLSMPDSILSSPPSADLWEEQTDEKELGFSYEEADPVLYLHFDKKMTAEDIKQKGYEKVDEILEVAKRNAFKHKVPYLI